MRVRTERQIDGRADASRFYNLSHAVCYSYGADNNDARRKHSITLVRNFLPKQSTINHCISYSRIFLTLQLKMINHNAFVPTRVSQMTVTSQPVCGLCRPISVVNELLKCYKIVNAAANVS